MPYISQEQRSFIEDDWIAMSKPGELNYVFTKVILGYLDKMGESYNTYNEIIGALECAKLELYRRMVVPYENIKWAENGDVYGRT